jgi:hypothetical protein
LARSMLLGGTQKKWACVEKLPRRANRHAWRTRPELAWARVPSQLRPSANSLGFFSFCCRAGLITPVCQSVFRRKPFFFWILPPPPPPPGKPAELRFQPSADHRRAVSQKHLDALETKVRDRSSHSNRFKSPPASFEPVDRPVILLARWEPRGLAPLVRRRLSPFSANVGYRSAWISRTDPRR